MVGTFGDAVADRHVAIERQSRVLEYHLNSGMRGGMFHAVIADGATVGGHEACDDAKEGRFSRAAFAHDGDDLAFAHEKVDAFENGVFHSAGRGIRFDDIGRK